MHDWMPEEYRSRLIRFIEMHGNSELMGLFQERRTGSCAPRRSSASSLSPRRSKREVGHAQLIYRVVEDLGKPRSACLDDLMIEKFHNVFHCPRPHDLGDVGVIA